MKDTIRELWYGNINPVEECGADNRKIDHLLMLMEKNRINLSAELNEKQREIFQKFIDCSDEYAFHHATQAFADGFCLACRLMAEAFVA